MNNSFRRLRLDMTGRLHWPGAVCHPAGGRRTKARPATAPSCPWPWPGAASPPHPLGRLPPSARPPPPPPNDRRRNAGPASRCAGGGRQDTPVMASGSAKNGSAYFGGLKNDPTKPASLQFLHQKVRRLFLGRYWKNHGDRINTSEDINKKHEGRAESAPPFQCAC